MMMVGEGETGRDDRSIGRVNNRYLGLFGPSFTHSQLFDRCYCPSVTHSTISMLTILMRVDDDDDDDDTGYDDTRQ